MKKQIILMSGLIISLLMFGKCTNKIIKDKNETIVSNTDQSNNSSQRNYLDDALQNALHEAKKRAIPLIDSNFHNGKTIVVPDDYKSIQSAIDVAVKGDIVLVKPGTYYELIVMKDGIKLISDASNGGDELVSTNGAWLELPKRTFRTIIDGSRSETSKHGMFDFNPEISRKSIIDGFTIQHLPKQNHHIQGHAHGLNVRGANPVIMNCLIQKMGSTGIGMHVIFKDQGQPVATRDFREANIKYQASPVIYNNIVRDNYGLGIGSNHFSKAFILGNEIINNNDKEINGTPSPAIGNKHGSAATIVGNIVHDNPGGGILAGKGEPQGNFLIDKPTHPKMIKNVIYNNGTIRPALSCNQAGSIETPIEMIGNYIYDVKTVGISITNESVVIIEDNLVSGTTGSGIIVMNSNILRNRDNNVSESLNKTTTSNVTTGITDFKTMQEAMLQKLTIKMKQFHDDVEMESFFKQKIDCAQKATNTTELEACKKLVKGN